VFRAIVVLGAMAKSVQLREIWLMLVISKLRRRSALEEMIQQNATQKLFRQEILKGTYNCKRK
jgi:hypothetical protein